ncbi:MAG: carboxypeptidase regulatory-like domain-containing protein [Planctomycetes bacterium]|nr:carboxypeptidase regulatory-like domain-containing protein [Planctomycetota bacterium]
MTRRTAPVWLGVALVLAAGCNNGGGNPSPTRVSGAITRAGTGSALDEFVMLLFTPTGGGNATEVAVDNAGTFDAEIAAGTYDVAAMRPGYEDAMQSDVQVAAGQTTTVDLTLTALPANTYITSAQCAVCHDAIYQTFRQTGHPYKLNRVDGAAPEYPFTSLVGVEARIDDDDGLMGDPHPGTDNTLGTPSGWPAMTYVIGGFHWKARFMDANGFIVTGSEVQYNFATDSMVPYDDNVVDKPFNCGNCHTTGWQHFDATVNNRRQDNLPGMDGTFTEQGIGCESCHGAGAEHAQTMSAAHITRIATPRQTADFMDGSYGFGKPVACGECHTRDGERDYPSFASGFDTALAGASKPAVAQGGRVRASGGLIQHHEQFDEILGIDPDTLDSTRSVAFMGAHGNCMTCHDPHKATVKIGESGVVEFGVDKSNAACLSCHQAAQYDPANNSRGSMRNLDCVDCHMPRNAKSATSTTLPNGVVLGDVSSHTFTIDVDGTQFTSNGSFQYPWLGLDFACRNCHGDGSTFDITPVQAQGFDYHPN